MSPDGSAVDTSTRDRIKLLAIPPAWRDVWICPAENGHLLVTGRDARGRKQYLYHPRWRKVRDETKFHRMAAFGRALPAIRAQVDCDLRQHKLTKRRVIAAMITLLDGTALRIGNEQYARENESYGLTTVSRRHIEVSSTGVELTFVGKSGKKQSVNLRSPRVSRVVAQCCDLPGRQLFGYLDDDGAVRKVHSDDVNEYLKEASGGDFTAKDFRTWRGSVVAALTLAELATPNCEKERRAGINLALEAAARVLGNTVAICRKCYVHPDVLEAFESGDLRPMWLRNRASWLRTQDDPAERLFLCLLKQERSSRN